VGSMPTYHVSKGPFRMLDFMFDEPGSPTFEAALDRLANPDSTNTLLEAARQRNRLQPGDLSDTDVKHFDEHWLDGWWGELAPADTLRAGMREAIAHAITANKPMEFFWICVLDDEFQIYYCEGPRQVTVLVLTPPPPDHTSGPVDLLSTPEPIWVVTRRHDYDDAYPNLGDQGLIDPPVHVADLSVDLAPQDGAGDDIVKQQVHHT
jgi:hypothetical protein